MAGDGNDTIYGGSGNDTITGGAGNNTIYGGSGNNTIYGGSGDNLIYGGTGTDTIYGGSGSNEIYGSALGSVIYGGSGPNIIYGGSSGTDVIYGGTGTNRIHGGGGNNWIEGGPGDDIIVGGSGNNTIIGGGGADLLEGGSGTNIIYGNTGNDTSTSYIYGGPGTNYMYGSANDLIFGTNSATSSSGNPADLIAPTVTLAAPGEASDTSALAVNTLPTGPAYNGWWGEIAGSASGSGLTGGVAAASDPVVAVDSSGTRYVAWSDSRNGNNEIYVACQSASGWEMLGGSAQGGGVSDTTGSSTDPSLIIDSTGAPIVAWTESTGTFTDIRAARYDSSSNTWVALGDSLSTGGLSQTGKATNAQIVMTNAGPVVAWLDTTSGVPQVKVSRFNGTSWSILGSGAVTNASGGVNDYNLATDGTKIAVAWSAGSGGQSSVYVAQLNGTTWSGIGGSTASGGISGNSGDNRQVTAAFFQGSLFVAWCNQSNGFEQIYAKEYNNTAWSDAGTGAASGAGVSNSARMAVEPRLASAGGKLYLAWVDESNLDQATGSSSIYVKTWNGSAFAEQLAGDASGGGIDSESGEIEGLSLTVGQSGLPTVAWSDETSGLPQVYLRTITQQANRVFSVAAGASIQAVLNSNTLGAGDVILLASGSYAGFTLSAADSGVLILGAQGQTSTITGAVTVAAGAGGVIQRLQLNGGLVDAGSNGLTIVDCRIAGELTLTGGNNLQILHNSFTGAGEGIRLAAASQGLIAYNDIATATTGIDLAFPFSGLIMDNTIHGAAVGVSYAASAGLSGNKIYGNTVGVKSTVSGSDGLGFVGDYPLQGIAGGYLQNEIYGNATGIILVNANVEAQWVYDNTTGISGSGTVGGSDFDYANLIESNTTGVNVTGTVQFSRIAQNSVGIQATSGELIAHNMIYRNSQAGVLVNGQSSVEIVGNTFYAPQGDNIRVEGGSSQVEVLDDILWAESGYDIYVANDSQSGFFSDYNDLYVTGTGKIGYWTMDFTDILDWQDDIDAFDLHSIGATVVNPAWAEPQFYDLARDDYRVFPEVEGQRFSSPTVDAGDPLTDEGLPSSYVNLLTNGNFDSGLTGWTTSIGATTQSLRSCSLLGHELFLGRFGFDRLCAANHQPDSGVQRGPARFERLQIGIRGKGEVSLREHSRRRADHNLFPRRVRQYYQ